MEIAECSICMDNLATMILAPCGHSLCEKCATTLHLTSEQCSECRQEIVFIVKNYLLIKILETYFLNSSNKTISNNAISINNSSANQNICDHIFIRGKRVGTRCTSKSQKDVNFCREHIKLVCNKNLIINKK